MFFNLFFILQHVLQLVLHFTTCSSQIKPSIQELKPITRTPKKRKNKLSSLTFSLMNPSSPIHSQQEQLSRSQDPNNMTTQNQDQLSRSQDPNSITHKTNPNKTQQDLNRMTNLTDLKKSVAALVVEVDSLGSAKEKEADLTHLLNVLSLSIEAHGLHGKASNLHHHHLLRWFYL